MAGHILSRILRFFRSDFTLRLRSLLASAPLRKALLFPWGALLGAAVGLLLGLGLFGAVFGLIIGYLLDVMVRRIALSRSYAEVDSLLRSPRTNEDRSRLAVAAWLSFRTAELSGRVTYADLHYLSQRIASLFAVSEAGKEAIAYVREAFLAGVRPDDEVLLAGKTHYPGREERVALSLSLWEAATLHGASSPRIDAFIRRAASAYGVESYYRTAAGALLQEPADREESYRILGVDENVTPDELKRVYRSLAASFHPDSLADLSPRQQETAHEAFIRIRRAYERLMEEMDNG
jgi:DnaJ like chaperone protein